MSAKALSDISVEIETLATAHASAKAEEDASRRAATVALNALREKQKEFDAAVVEFKNDASDNFNNRWGPKFARAAD